MKKCFLSLSFDDGRLDNYENAYQIMKKYNIKGTFHIITGFTDNSIKIQKIDPASSVISKEKMNEMKKDGNEISSHSNDHGINTYEIKKSIKKLKKWKFGEKFGFSIPRSNEKIYEDSEFLDLVKNKELLYVRTGKNTSKLTFIKKVNYVLYNLTGIQFFYNNYNKININVLKKFNKYRIYSIPIHKNDNVKTIKKFIKKYEDKDVYIVLMFHSIIDYNSKNDIKTKWVWDKSMFNSLCAFLKDEEINVLTIDEAIKIIERINT